MNRIANDSSDLGRLACLDVAAYINNYPYRLYETDRSYCSREQTRRRKDNVYANNSRNINPNKNSAINYRVYRRSRDKLGDATAEK